MPERRVLFDPLVQPEGNPEISTVDVATRTCLRTRILVMETGDRD